MLSLGLGLGLTTRASGSTPWTPAALGSSLLGWWDASDAANIGSSGSWTDRVGGYAPTQATGAARPAYSSTSFNGGPGLTFDGTDDCLQLLSQPFQTGAASGEIWALVNVTIAGATTPAGRTILSFGGDTFDTHRRLGRQSVSNVNRAQALVGIGAGGSSTNVQSTTDFSGIHVGRAVVSGTDVYTTVDGVAQAATSPVTPATGTTRLAIGGNSNSSGVTGFFQGVVSAILVTSLLTSDQAAQLLAYLKARGGIV